MSASNTSSSEEWLHRFAVFTSCCTFFLIVAGGLVTSTGSGLAVPDWPLSFGQLMPPMVGGVFYEHGHRMVATFVGFLTLVLAGWLWAKEDRAWVRTLGLLAVVAVVTQGILGGLTVLFLLPAPISAAHATLAQSFFCLTIILATVLSPSWKARQVMVLDGVGRIQKMMILTSVLILIQLILGAFMRHTESGLAIPDFPLSYGLLLPILNQDQLHEINALRIAGDLPAVTMGQIWIHFAHRFGAVIVSVVVLLSVRTSLRMVKNDPRMREPAIALGLLLLFQFLLGALTVWTGKGVQIATAHVATGALLFGTSVFITFNAFSLYRTSRR